MVGQDDLDGESHTEETLDHALAEEEIDQNGDDFADSKPKKKRRVIKTADKKFECPEENCGKSYSRAEHLYRHQLNRELHIPQDKC